MSVNKYTVTEAGPFVTAAFVCDKISIDQNKIPDFLGVFESKIGIRNGLPGLQGFKMSLVAVVGVTCGESPRGGQIEVKLLEPDGSQLDRFAREFVMEKPGDRVYVAEHLDLTIHKTGRYTFLAFIGGALITSFGFVFSIADAPPTTR